MPAFRRSRFWPWLALLAIVAQLLLPVRHAAMLAHASGDPLQAAFCGKASVAALQQLQASAPAELIAALHLRSAEDDIRSDAGHCQFCTGSAGGQTAVLASAAPVLHLLVARHEVLIARIALTPVQQQTPLPVVRGPPSIA